MWPTLIEVQTWAGPIAVRTYGLFIALAFSAAFLYVHFRAMRIGVNPDRLLPGYVSAAIGGLLGGRILYAVAVDWENTLSNPISLVTNVGGFAVYGGIIGGIIGVGLFVRHAGLDIWKIADIAAPSVVLGEGVGRFGCFFAGCCHGAHAPIGDHPVGLLPEAFRGGQIWLSDTFPFVTTEFASTAGGVTRSELLDLPLYPTQLWSIVGFLSLAAVLAALWRKRRFYGQIAALTLMAEPLARIFIESFRADHRGYVVQWPVSETVARWLPGLTRAGAELEGPMMGLTTSQFIGVVAILAGVGIYLVRRGAGVAEERPLETLADDMLDELVEG